MDPKIPFSSKGLYIHAPLEVRGVRNGGKNRQFLDPTMEEGDSLLLNATLYRPYLQDPPCRERYYQAFEWLMRDLGGRPHWAKNFLVGKGEIEGMYGTGLGQVLGTWRAVRNRVDPDGMFVGPWHRRLVMEGSSCLSLEEVDV
jgi:D-arabinono-1,4-lactone oxidase